MIHSFMQMSNPVQGTRYGSEMSEEGAQNILKHGGAHGSPRESSFDDGILYLSKDSMSEDVQDITDTNSLHLVQDGGTISLLAEDMVDIYQYDQPAEWMRSKCKSLTMDFDGVSEENVGDMLGLGSESKVDNLMAMGGQLLNNDENGIILCADGVSLVTSGITSGNDAKCSDIIPMCNILSDDLGTRTVSSSQSSSSGRVFSDIPASLDASGITFTAFTDKTMTKHDSMESDDLVQSGQTCILETESSLVSSTQSLLGSSAVASVTSSSVSDCGLTSILPNFLGIDSSPGNELSILNDCSVVGGESFQQNMFVTCGDSNEAATAPSDTSAKVDLNDPSNVTLAMISVSTDKDANSTQIVINTSQGQQLYMINMASLGQASVVAQPVAVDSSGLQGSTLQATSSPNQFVLLPWNGSVVGGVIQEPMSSEDSSSRDQFVCDEPGCDKTFSKPCKLKVHQMQHTGERPFRCKVEGCDWAFTTAYKLKRHMESHEGKRDFYCEVPGCNRKFTTVYNLKTHMRLHQRPCNEVCPHEGCRESFPTRRLLEAHLKVHSGNRKIYQCPVEGCNAMFYSPISIGSHRRIHNDLNEPGKEIRCEFEGCGKVFNRYCRLKQHMRQHTGEKPYICHVEGCNWAFTTASKLRRHSLKHQNIRRFKCDICDKTFMRSEHLRGHVITHSGNKPFKCTVEGCGASFTASSSLYVHRSKHDKNASTGGKVVYRCPLEGCSRKYSSKAMLRNHLSKHIMNGDPSQHIAPEIAQLLMNDRSEGEELLEGEEGEEEESEEVQYGEEEGVEISADQLTGAAVSQLLSQPVTISPQPQPQPTISLESNQSRAVYLKNRSGCARTDFQSNHLISNQARTRWYQQRDEVMQGSGSSSMDTSPLLLHSDNSLGLVKQEQEMYAGHDSMTALTFRDPETGMTLMQTQLLQDDPPHTVYCGGDPMGLNGDSSDVNSVLFPNTTINLNDLV